MSANRVPLIIAAAVAFGCTESAVAPTTQSDFPTLQASVGSQVVHRVTAGGPDGCDHFGLKPGCDANFSLVALQRADGSVTGQLHDQSGQAFGGGIWLHVAVNCLVVIGNQAWVSGVITQSRTPGLVGQGAIVKVVDNGRSANDPADQIGGIYGSSTPCSAATGIGFFLFSVPQGQVVVD